MISFRKIAYIKWLIIALMALILLGGCSNRISSGNTSSPNASSVNPVNPTGKDINNIQKQSENTTGMHSGQDISGGKASLPSASTKQVDLRGNNKSIVYKNTKYGFNFTLPMSWQGYTIVKENWKGSASDDSQGLKDKLTGPMISIRHPLWTSENPRQDIPIMVFTQDQWNLLLQGKFNIGAAPIGPSELGHNSTYVFALPARYNFAFPIGFEEVEAILKSSPLQPIE
ncbi:MAG: hypothetical protein ACYDG2_14040 [Ruminiclostridium sp.]